MKRREKSEEREMQNETEEKVVGEVDTESERRVNK